MLFSVKVFDAITSSFVVAELGLVLGLVKLGLVVP